MRARLLPLALTLAAATAAGQSHHPGPVVLLGGRADPGLVPVLAQQAGPSLLLVAGPAVSPAPLDARAWGGGPATEVVLLSPAGEARVDRALLERVRAAELIALGPGSPREWLEALLDRERSSAMLSALHEAWSDGATLVGRGGSAALLSAAFAVRAPDELDWDVRNPTDDGGSRAAQGLGYQPWAMIDTEERSEGSLQRLVRSICHEGIELGLYLPADASLVADLTSARLRVHGTGTVVLLDARRARRVRETVRGARLTRLPPGAVWDVGQRRVALAAEPGPGSGPAPSVEVRRELGDLYAPDLGATSAQGVDWRRLVRDDGRRRLELRFDGSSRWGRMQVGPDGSAPGPCWVEGLACDLDAQGL